jgi:hypothetical protein
VKIFGSFFSPEISLFFAVQMQSKKLSQIKLFVELFDLRQALRKNASYKRYGRQKNFRKFEIIFLQTGSQSKSVGNFVSSKPYTKVFWTSV